MGLFSAISGGLGIVSGLTSLFGSGKSSSSYSGSQDALAAVQAQATQDIMDRYHEKYWPLEDLYIDYTMQDVQTLRPAYENQVDYYAQRLDEQLGLAKDINPILDDNQKSLIRKLVEGEDVLADRLRSTATADVGAAYASQREQDARAMGLAGINPNSGQMQNYLNRMGQSQALAEASARTQASRDAEDISLARQATALNYYQSAQLPSYNTMSSGTSLGQAQSFAAGASNIYGGLAANASKKESGAMSSLLGGINLLGQGLNIKGW